MIHGFADKETEKFWNGGGSRRIPANLRDRVMAKLQTLNAAISLESLSRPPGNQLEALTGDRKGQHSIRVNQQYRLCFVWKDDGPDQVEFVDYH